MSKRTPEPDGAIRSEVFAGEYTRVVTTFGARKLGACKVSFGDAALQSPIADGCRKPRNSGAARASTAPSQTRSSLVSTHKNGPLPQCVAGGNRRHTVRRKISSVRYKGFSSDLNGLAENCRIVRRF